MLNVPEKSLELIFDVCFKSCNSVKGKTQCFNFNYIMYEKQSKYLQRYDQKFNRQLAPSLGSVYNMATRKT